MTERTRLPNRRATQTLDLEIHRLKFTASFSFFPDGRLAELFLQNHKPGSQSDINARDAAVVTSIALQYGVPLEVSLTPVAGRAGPQPGRPGSGPPQ